MDANEDGGMQMKTVVCKWRRKLNNMNDPLIQTMLIPVWA